MGIPATTLPSHTHTPDGREAPQAGAVDVACMDLHLPLHTLASTIHVSSSIAILWTSFLPHRSRSYVRLFTLFYDYSRFHLF